MIKRFLVFAGQKYYPCGGVRDLASDCLQTEDDAKSYADSLIGKGMSYTSWINDDGSYDVEATVEWAQVYDAELCQIVHSVGISDSSVVILAEESE